MVNFFLTGNDIRSNTAVDGKGGGLHLFRSNQVVATRNNFVNNSSSISGGVEFGEIVLGGSVLFEDNVVKGNRANGDGGIRILLTPNALNTVTVNRNIISQNSARQNYGGIFINGYPSSANASPHTVTFSDNVIQGNFTDKNSYGGGSINLGSGATINFTGNTILDNDATESYGGMNLNSGYLNAANNLVARNRALNGSAGGLQISTSVEMNFINNTVTDNSSTNTSGGAGLRISVGANADLFVYNNILFGNTGAVSGADLFLEGTGSNNKNLFNNNIDDIDGTLFDFAVNNINVAPLFIDPANDDYHLQGTSLALNVGENNAPRIPFTDKDGFARILDGFVDLGAYEHSSVVLHPADTDMDGTLTSNEVTVYGDAWRTGASWPTPPTTIPIDYVTRAGFLLQNGGDYQNKGGGKPLNWVIK